MTKTQRLALSIVSLCAGYGGIAIVWVKFGFWAAFAVWLITWAMNCTSRFDLDNAFKMRG